MRHKLWIGVVSTLAVIFCFVWFSNTSLAHPGRTDSQGGHYNRKTGEYHFHNGASNSGAGGRTDAQNTPYPDVTLEPASTLISMVPQASLAGSDSSRAEHTGGNFLETLLIMIPILAILRFLLIKIANGPWWVCFVVFPLGMLIVLLFLSWESTVEIILMISGILYILYHMYIWFFRNWRMVLKHVLPIYVDAHQLYPDEDNEYYFFYVIEKKYPLVARGPLRKLYERKEQVLYGTISAASYSDELDTMQAFIKRYTLPSVILFCLFVENHGIIRKYQKDIGKLYKLIEAEVIRKGFSQYC